MMRYIIKLAAILFVAIPQLAEADLSNTILFTLNTIYLDRDFNDNGIRGQEKTTDTDIRLGKVFKHYYAGAIYSQSSNDSSDASRTSYGISTGYFSDKDLYIAAHYFFSSKFARGGGVIDEKGSGFEIDLGGLFKFTSSFYMGLMMAYKTFSYSERNTAGVTTGTSVSHRELLPLFTVGFAFQ